MTTENVLLAAQAIVDSALAGQTARAAFAESAKATARAWLEGASDLSIANTVKTIKGSMRKPIPRSVSLDLYTSPTAVGFHRRTGLLLLRGGDLPMHVEARDVQTLVKGVPAAVADEILAANDSAHGAFLDLRRAQRPAQEVHALRALADTRSAVQRLVALSEWDENTILAARSIAALLNERLASEGE